MGNFMTYLLEHRLQEITELFPKPAMNALFQQEIEKVMPLVDDAKVKADLLGLFNTDFVGYTDKSLRGAGFTDEQERDALIHDLFVKWLVQPGGLVSKWKMDAPLSFRFKKAVKNAIATLVMRVSRRRRRFGEMPDDQVAREQPLDEDDLIAQFRQWLGKTLGPTAVVVFDARLAGEETRSLVGATTDIPSAYAVKNIVKSIKQSLARWAKADPPFQAKISRLLDLERQTIDRRFKRVGA